MTTAKIIYHMLPEWLWELIFLFCFLVFTVLFCGVLPLLLEGLIDMAEKKISKIKKTRQKSLTLYVVFSIAIILVFTIVEMIVSTISGISHDTLITCFYSVFGGEILCCALIKIFKLKTKEEEDEYGSIIDSPGDSIGFDNLNGPGY